MIQAVVDRNAFHIGNQYLSENRVRIVEADDAQISSAVIGNSGLYEQTIRLKDGTSHLKVQLCAAGRADVSSLYCGSVGIPSLGTAEKWSAEKSETVRLPTADTGLLRIATRSAPGPASPTDLKLGEVMAFIEWLQPAIKALERGQTLPDSPKLGGDVAPWIQVIRNLEERRRESEEVRINLESDMRDREAYVGRLTQQMQASMEEIKAAQASSQQLQQELTACKEMLTKVSEVASEVGSYDSQLKSIAGEVMSKGSQLDKLAQSFREVSTALKALAKTSATS